MVSPLNSRLHRFIITITQVAILVIGYPCLPAGRGLSVIDCYAQSSKYIRVAILQDAESLSIKIAGLYKIVDSESKKILYQDKDLKTIASVYQDNILIGSRYFNAGKVLIRADDPKGAISIDGRRFRGGIQIIRKNNSHLSAINYIELEDYIKGILYHEVSHYWPQEILKAQAIVCRTYAVYQMQESALKDYDVTSDIYSQVYGGKTSERYRTNKAVAETTGKVLTYQDKVFPAYYHAACAGHTEDASLLWNINIAPLKGVPCGYCKESPHFRWHRVLSHYELKDALVKAGYDNFKVIKDIVILGRDSSGRITDLKILTDGKEIKISAKDFRNIIGPNAVKSTNFRVDIINSDIVFEGYGWGHGVGLCQWGGYFMAKQGYSFDEILRYYYPQTDIKGIY